MWYIDGHRRLFFHERTKYQAPWTLTADKCLYDTLTIENSNPRYRNQQVITGVRDITDVQVNTRKGDGENDTFVTSFAVARVPEVKVARDNDYTGDRPTQEEWDAIQPDEVGIRGLQEDKDWYWSGGSHEINQDREGTILGTNDYIRVEYRGEYPLVIKTRSPSNIEDRKEVEKFGTGIVENVKQEPASRTREGSFELASQLLQKYTQIGRILKTSTWQAGLKPGQILPVLMPKYGIDETTEMLIESVTTRQDGDIIFYEIQAVEGPELKSWTKFFEQIVTRGEDIIREGIGEDEMIIIPFEFEKDWVEMENPNILRHVYPDSTYTAGDALTPMFNPEDRVRYLEWEYDNGTRERKLITDSSGLDEIDVNEVYTLTYLDPGEALGTIVEFAWVGGIRVKTQVGTGIIVDTQTETVSADPGEQPWTKSELESWQIEKTDKKWS